MKCFLACSCALALSSTISPAADAPITWLVHYDAKSLPQEQGWKAFGELAAKATLSNGALHLVDDSAKADGAFRAAWKPQPGTEIVVEATVRVESVAARRGTGMWPAQQGAPVGLLLSDGVHQEGLLLRPEKIATFHDRVAMFDAKTEFHTYQLVIRDRDMSIAADGKVMIRGEGAFWKKAENAEAFVQFGSTAPGWMGDAHWQSVRLGLATSSWSAAILAVMWPAQSSPANAPRCARSKAVPPGRLTPKQTRSFTGASRHAITGRFLI